MNALSTPMIVTRMQSAPIQKGHLLASATWIRITLAMEKHALLIVSRAFFMYLFINSFLHGRWQVWKQFISSMWKEYKETFIHTAFHQTIWLKITTSAYSYCRSSWFCCSPRISNSLLNVFSGFEIPAWWPFNDIEKVLPGIKGLHLNAGYSHERVTSNTWGPPPLCKQALRHAQLNPTAGSTVQWSDSHRSQIYWHTTSFKIKTNFWLTFSGGLSDSVILANDVSKITQLNNWLLPHLQSSDRSYWKLCFRASIHGWRSRTFHSYCDNKGPTVTIVRVGIYIFGGYNDNSWQCKSVR